jgi:zinc ribbon protein
MDPQISHRCPSCGASVRARAAFCPQCGTPIKQSGPVTPSGAKEASAIPSSENEIKETPRRSKSDRDVRTTPLPPVSQIVKPVAMAPPAPVDDGVDAKGGNHSRPAPSVAAEIKKPKPSQRLRMAQAARGVVQDNVRPHVEKLRQASSVVFEEVAIDPSLRFVVIAIVLFLFFILLLVLSFIR